MDIHKIYSEIADITLLLLFPSKFPAIDWAAWWYTQCFWNPSSAYYNPLMPYCTPGGTACDILPRCIYTKYVELRMERRIQRKARGVGGQICALQILTSQKLARHPTYEILVEEPSTSSKGIRSRWPTYAIIYVDQDFCFKWNVLKDETKNPTL